MSFLQKIIRDYRQFGIKVLIQHGIKALLRPVYRNHITIVYQMPAGSVPVPENVTVLTKESLDKYSLSEKDHSLFSNFLEAGDRGFAFIVDDAIAGSTWIQEKGDYVFGKAGRFRIPQNTAVLKNLFVNPQYRGKGIAGKLNQASLAAIPQKTAIVFIIPENRYAIRNWVKFGMKPLLIVSLYRFFHGKWKIKFSSLDPQRDCKDIQNSFFTC